MTDEDSLTIKKFDSDAGSSLLDQSIAAPAKKKREEFAKANCPTILPEYPRAGALPGTDIRPLWLKFYKDYKERKLGDGKKDGIPHEIFVVYVESLEKMFDQTDKVDETSMDEFKNSLQDFINGDNYILFMVSDHKDRDLLARKLDSLKNQGGNLLVVDPSHAVESSIEQLYKRAKTGKN